MRVTLTRTDGSVIELATPEPGELTARVDGICPQCGVEPYAVHGHNRHVESRDTYAADAVAECCGADVGTLRVAVETIFGIEEDGAMLAHGRARVYT